MNPDDPNNPQGGAPADTGTPEPAVPGAVPPMGGNETPGAPVANCHCGKPSANGTCVGCNQPEAGCTCQAGV